MEEYISRFAALGVLLGLVAGGVVGFGGVAVASPTPTGVCPVCGNIFHPNVTGTTATLQLTAEGDIHWHVENEVADPTATTWRQHPDAARDIVVERIDSPWRQPRNPTDVTVHMAGDTLVVEFVDKGAARHRLGLLLVPYLHGEGVEARYVINADRFVVVAPEGQRIVNDPAGATVQDDRAVWTGVATGDGEMSTGLWNAPLPGDTYVLTGSGVTAPVRAPLVGTLEPLDPRMYGIYAFGALVVLLPVGVAAVSSHRLGSRHLLGGLGLGAVPYVAVVALMHPIHPANTLPGMADYIFLFTAALVCASIGAFVLSGWLGFKQVVGTQD